jgi:peptidoglycan/LPS O-acetylase OafA/YrhL
MHRNNFDILRLTFAAIVVLFHSYVLSNNSSLFILARLFNPEFAVEGFFAISGFLIFASYESNPSLREYFTKRAARILPGYWLATALCLLIACVSGSFHVGKFLMANLTFTNFLHPNIPGVFPINPVPDVMDGALWTIKIEVLFYIAVPLIVWICRRWHRDGVLIGLLILSTLFRTAFASHNALVRQFPGELCFFMVGALIFYHLPLFTKYGKWIMLAAGLAYALHISTGWFFLRPLAVVPLTLGAGLLLPVVEGPTRWGDFSYGTYVLHFPILQVAVAKGLFRVNPWAALAISLLVIAACSVASWFLVEKPALQLARTRFLGANPHIPLPANIST